MRLYLVRHARTAPAGPDAREWRLSTEGEAQARALASAPFWPDAHALYSSPEEKVLATVRPAAELHGLEIREDVRLREAGRPAVWIDDYEAAVRRYLQDPDRTPEGWEPAREVRSRMTELLWELEEKHRGERVVVCGHGLALTLYVSLLEGAAGSPFEIWRGIGFGKVAVAEGGRLLLPFGAPSAVGVQVRRVEPRDYEAVSTLLAELGRPAVTPATLELTRGVFERHVASTDAESLLALRDGQPVGLLSLHIRERLNHPTPEAWIPDLIVTERERGSGVARLLFRQATEAARDRGCHRLVLESGYARRRAHRFYEREGMTDAGKFFSVELR
jgi:broad specificity phosphatase PhoE